MDLKFSEGDEVRLVKPYPDERLSEGQLCIVEFAYDDVPEGEDPIYALSSETGGWSGKECPEGYLERTRTWQQMSKRRLPTPFEIISSLNILGYSSEGIEYNETDVGTDPENDAIEIYGKAENGLTFGAELQVVRIWHTDF